MDRSYGSTCPECANPFNADKDINLPSGALLNKISEIQLRCPFNECSSVGRYIDFKTHKLV